MNFIFLFHRKARLFFFNLFDSKRMFRSGKHRFRNFQSMTAQKKLLMNSPQWQLICLYLSDYQRNFVLYIITMKNFIDQPETLAHKTADKKNNNNKFRKKSYYENRSNISALRLTYSSSRLFFTSPRVLAKGI